MLRKLNVGRKTVVALILAAAQIGSLFILLQISAAAHSIPPDGKAATGEALINETASNNEEQAQKEPQPHGESGEYLPIAIATTAIGAITLITIYTFYRHSKSKKRISKR